MCTHPSRSAPRRSQCRAGGTGHVSRAEHTACSPSLATVRGEPEHSPRPGQLPVGAQAARAQATATQPVPRPGCTVVALRALLAARARVRPTPVGCCGSTTVPRRDGSVSRSANGASKPAPRPTQVLVRALCALRTARGRVRIAPTGRVASASCLAAASTRAHPPPGPPRIGVTTVCGARGARFEGTLKALIGAEEGWRRRGGGYTRRCARTSAHVSGTPGTTLLPCSTLSGERSAGGTRQCPPHPAAECGVRYTLSTFSRRHAHVTARPRARDHPPPPWHAGSALCSLSAARTRVRPPRPDVRG